MAKTCSPVVLLAMISSTFGPGSSGTVSVKRPCASAMATASLALTTALGAVWPRTVNGVAYAVSPSRGDSTRITNSDEGVGVVAAASVGGMAGMMIVGGGGVMINAVGSI